MSDKTYEPGAELGPCCATCRFCALALNESVFECRRRAPVNPFKPLFAQWPMVKGADWCGEYESGVAREAPSINLHGVRPSTDGPYCYGFCPRCGRPGVSRERRPNGNDRCIAGHEYPSTQARAA